MKALAKTALRKTYKSYQQQRFHALHRKQAAEALVGIEKDRGPTDPGLLKLSDEYAVDVLGDAVFAPWLYVYSAVNGAFREGWMPDNYFGWVVLKKTKGMYADVSALRAMPSYIFADPSFPDRGFHANGRLFDAERNMLPVDKAKEVLFANGDAIVFKADASGRGDGIYFLQKADFDPFDLKALPDGVFQSYVKQHAFFDRYTDASVATLRMTTAQDPTGAVALRAAYLRFGQGRDTHVKSESHIRVTVDLQSGELAPSGYRTDWTMLDAHPDNQEPFAGKVIPNYQECVQKVCELHEKFPFIQSIGWDVIVDTEGAVQVMEWNGAHNDIKFSEATQGPCFKGLGWEDLWKEDEAT